MDTEYQALMTEGECLEEGESLFIDGIRYCSISFQKAEQNYICTEIDDFMEML